MKFMQRNVFFGGAMLLLILTSCSSLTPFSQDLYDKNGWSISELKKIQFYLSEDVILKRIMTRGESNITAGKIRIEDGRRIEEIRIPANTPGVLLFTPRENRFAVSFEAAQGDDLYLMFGPNPKLKDRYALLASEWSRNEGKVHYNGNQYEVDARSALATLMVDMKRTGTTEYSGRKVGGRRVE
jgi:hypothetical protein